jgi:hypothetical protein
MCLRTGRGGKDVGIGNQRGTRGASPGEDEGVRQVSMTSDRDGVAEPDGSLMFPKVLRLAPREGISARLIVPHVGEVLQGETVGKDVQESQ